ncbi:MAG: hypothetical protein WCF85_00705 [Rhodospirillaceae bacterium]
MNDLEALEAEAGLALREHRTGAVLAACRALIALAPERPTGWVYQALALFLDGKPEAVYRRLLPHCRRKTGYDCLLVLKDVFLLLAKLKAGDVILDAAAKAPLNELYSVIPTYFAACVLLERKLFEPGFALLTGFRARCLENLAALPTGDSDGFMVLFRHALLVNDDSYLESDYFHDNLAANHARLSALSWSLIAAPEADDSRAVLAVSCDPRYAELFLPRFLESVDRFCSGRLVHLHLIDPASDPPVLPAALTRNRLAVTTETSGALKSSAWYASARFVRMEELLAHYRRPVVMYDIDIALLHPPELLEQAMAEADFGCFRMPRLDPGSVYQASVTAFRPTPAGLELSRLLRDLILSKMSLKHELLWLIDQACLYSAITSLADRAGRLRVADFTAELGMAIEDHVEFCDRNEEKLRLMKLASGAY